MKIIEIKVKAGSLFKHPKETYANFTTEIELRASVGPNEDLVSVVRALQGKAWEHITEYKRNTLNAIG